MIRIKKENRKITVSLTFRTLKIKEKIFGAISAIFSVSRAIKKYFYFKFKLFNVILKILLANPQAISLKEKNDKNLISLSLKNELKNPVKNIISSGADFIIKNEISNETGGKLGFLGIIKNTIQKIKKDKRKVFASATAIIIISLFFPIFFSLIIPTKANDPLCPINSDVVLAVDISSSMGTGESFSKCEWSEIRNIPNEDYSTWFLNIKHNVTYQWCMEVRNQFDESSPTYQFKAPTYTGPKNNKIVDAKPAINSFLDNLKPTDQSALVSFNNTADLVKNLSSDHQTVKTFVDNLTPGLTNASNIGDAIGNATSELNSERATSTNKIIILLTDGKANKPYGYGYGEYLPDVDYALQKAQEAANLNQKIFTIGLGDRANINRKMLQNIADMTGGAYYYVAESSQLADIYNQIYNQISLGKCTSASISGCKYLDSNADGDIAGEKTLSGWEIVLSGDAEDTQLTDENGCYKFNELLPGNYLVSESENASQQPFLQTYPESQNYNINLVKGEQRKNIDFGNADNSLCKITDVPENCEKDGFRKHQFNYNYAYCGENYDQDLADEVCGCQTVELSRQCIADGQVEITFGYNFSYCGENFIQVNENLSCASEYQCGEWENVECASDGIMNQERICNDQYQNSYEEVRQVADETCACNFQETEKICASDGFANVAYSPNYAYCGENFNRQEQDSSCACLYSEWQNSVCDINNLRHQNRTQISQFNYCSYLEQNIEDAACASEIQRCGNGVLEKNEKCDDNNILNNDGCSASCQIEEEELPADNSASISGCKYNDANNNGQIEENEEKLGGWTIILEKQADNEWIQISTTTTQLNENFGCYSFVNLEPNNYRLKESLENQSGWLQTYPQNPSYWQIALAENQALLEVNFANYSASCGNNILDQNEKCDDGNGQNNDGCSASCQIEESPSKLTSTTAGGGGGLPQGLTIANQIATTTISTATITWTTPYPATSQVVYSRYDEPHTLDLAAPNYGYSHAYPDPEDTAKITGHTVTIPNLTPNTIYYFRSISHASPATIGSEETFTTKETPSGYVFPSSPAIIETSSTTPKDFNLPVSAPLKNLPSAPTANVKSKNLAYAPSKNIQSPAPKTIVENEPKIANNESVLKEFVEETKKDEVVKIKSGFIAGGILPALKYLYKPFVRILLLVVLIIFILYLLYRTKKNKKQTINEGFKNFNQKL